MYYGSESTAGKQIAWLHNKEGEQQRQAQVAKAQQPAARPPAVLQAPAPPPAQPPAALPPTEPAVFSPMPASPAMNTVTSGLAGMGGMYGLVPVSADAAAADIGSHHSGLGAATSGVRLPGLSIYASQTPDDGRMSQLGVQSVAGISLQGTARLPATASRGAASQPLDQAQQSGLIQPSSTSAATSQQRPSQAQQQRLQRQGLQHTSALQHPAAALSAATAVGARTHASTATPASPLDLPDVASLDGGTASHAAGEQAQYPPGGTPAAASVPAAATMQQPAAPPAWADAQSMAVSGVYQPTERAAAAEAASMETVAAAPAAALGPAAVLPRVPPAVLPLLPQASAPPTAALGDGGGLRVTPAVLVPAFSGAGASAAAAGCQPCTEGLLGRAPCSEGASYYEADGTDDAAGPRGVTACHAATCEPAASAAAAGLPCTEPSAVDCFASGRPKRTPGGNLADVR